MKTVMDTVWIRNCWRNIFVLYGVLSLSSMAGMGIGSGLFLAASLFFFYRSWSEGGAERLLRAYATPYSSISLGLFLACLASLVAAKLFPVEGSQAVPLFSSLKKFHYFLYPPLFALAFLEGGRIERHPFWKYWGAMGAFLGLVAMVQFFGAALFPDSWLHGEFFRPVGDTPRFHGQGLMFFHLSFASCMCFVAATAWARLVFPLRDETKRDRLLWAALALLSSLGVYYSYSRIALAALMALLVFLGFLRRPKVGLATALAVAVVAAAVWNLSSSLQTRFVQNEGGNIERKIMWRSAILMFQEHPLTGVGFSRTGELSPYYAQRVLGPRKPWFTSHAHDNFLDMLGATGLLGTFFFLAWWGFLFLAAALVFRRSPREERWLPAAALAGFLAFHINGITQVNFWDGKSEHTLMLFAGLTLALWLRERRGAAFP